MFAVNTRTSSLTHQMSPPLSERVTPCSTKGASIPPRDSQRPPQTRREDSAAQHNHEPSSSLVDGPFCSRRLPSLPFGFLWHSRQRESSSYHQKQSPHSSLGLCCIVVRNPHSGARSTLAPTSTHTVVHKPYQSANFRKVLGNTISYRLFEVGIRN